MNRRILVVEDEKRWQESFRAWIPEELDAEIDFAVTALEAANFLRRRRYTLVLLDLSMDVGDRGNRDNEPIQDYLSTRPEGTFYVVVSAVINKVETRDAAFRRGASDVLFKVEAPLAELAETVTRLVAESAAAETKVRADTRAQFLGGDPQQSRLLATLGPKGGARALFPVADVVAGRLAPLVMHRERPELVMHDHSVFGLGWSRQRGNAVALLLSPIDRDLAECAKALGEWLGYDIPAKPEFSKDIGKIRFAFWDQTAVSDTHFDLPVISVPPASDR